jgi:hypothetical protein
MTRPLTPAEKLRFHGYFPNLNVDNAVVSGEATNVYNCIAWTLGITDAWIWPGNRIDDFDPYYNLIGYNRTQDPNSPIAVWGYSFIRMTHGSISGVGHGPRWESKCGSDLRIQHGRDELSGNSPAYGNILAYYRPGLLLETAHKKMATIDPISTEQKDTLKKANAYIKPEFRKKFNKAFAEWKDTWFKGDLAVNSDPHARAQGREFDDLLELGKESIPLVVEALVDPSNFMALQLYDALQQDPKYLVHLEKDDPRILQGEQGKARLAVQIYIKNL